MINPYSIIIEYKGSDEDFKSHLEKYYLLDLFKELEEDFIDDKVFKGVVFFILWAYTPESEMLTTQGLDWSKLSQRIYKKTCLDEHYRDDVLELKSEYLRVAIQRWMNYINDSNFIQFITYRDLRNQFLAAANIPLPSGKRSGYKKAKKKKLVPKKSSEVLESEDALIVLPEFEEPEEEDEFDMSEKLFTKLKGMIDAKDLAAKKAGELKVLMDAALQTFIQHDPKLKNSVGMLNSVITNDNLLSAEKMFRRG